MASREVFHFDEFALDVGERRLLRGTETVRLSPKSYDVLVVLVRQSGRLVTKDELLAQVWPESFVEEGILNVHVAALRKALGDDTRPPAYIETVVRSGVSFRRSLRRSGPACITAAAGRAVRAATPQPYLYRSNRNREVLAVLRPGAPARRQRTAQLPFFGATLCGPLVDSRCS